VTAQVLAVRGNGETFLKSIMERKATLIGILTLSKSNGEVWELFVDYAFSSLIDMYSLRFVSRFFRAMIEDKRSKSIASKVVRRNFVHVLKQFLRFVSVPGAEDIILDNFFNRFLAHNCRPDYCISGGFALATLTRADLIEHNSKWSNTDLDIFISGKGYTREGFVAAWETFVRDNRELFLRDKNHIHGHKLCFPHLGYPFHCWTPRPTQTLLIREVGTWWIPGYGNRTQRVQFIFLNEITPMQYVRGNFDFTFLMNAFTIEADWREPHYHIENPVDVFERDGAYSQYFKDHWRDQWLNWRYRAPRIKSKPLPIFIKRAQVLVARLKDRRDKYEERGFLLHGPIPQGMFVRSRKPYLKKQRCRFSMPTIADSASEDPAVHDPSHPDYLGEGYRILRCQVDRCNDVCFFECPITNMLLCYAHRDFTLEDKEAMMRSSCWK
jgi:hypothetical protein